MTRDSIFSGSAQPHVVGIFGHYGNENLGDEAIIEALIDRIRAERPDTEIRCFSVHPRDSALRYGVIAHPIRHAGESESSQPGSAESDSAQERQPATRPPGTARSDITTLTNRLKTWMPKPLRSALAASARAPEFAREIVTEIGFLVRSHRRLRDIDALIIAGSNQFLDNFGGPWGFPYTLLKWSVLARLAGCRLLFVSVGAGPLDSPISRLMVRAAVRLSHYLSFRDDASQLLVVGNRPERSSRVYPDLAHSLRLSATDPSNVDIELKASKPAVAINPMPLYDERYWCATDSRRYEGYVARLAAFAEYLLARGYPVFLFPTQPKDINVARDVVRAMRPELASRLTQPDPIKRPRSVVELMNVIRSADILVATRFHGTLLSLHARRPVISICYYRKTRDLMREMGQEAYAIDFDELELAALIDRFHSIEGRRLEETAQISMVDDQFVAALEEQYREILPVVLGADKSGGAKKRR